VFKITKKIRNIIILAVIALLATGTSITAFAFNGTSNAMLVNDTYNDVQFSAADHVLQVDFTALQQFDLTLNTNIDLIDLGFIDGEGTYTAQLKYGETFFYGEQFATLKSLPTLDVLDLGGELITITVAEPIPNQVDVSFSIPETIYLQYLQTNAPYEFTPDAENIAFLLTNFVSLELETGDLVNLQTFVYDIPNNLSLADWVSTATADASIWNSVSAISLYLNETAELTQTNLASADMVIEFTPFESLIGVYNTNLETFVSAISPTVELAIEQTADIIAYGSALLLISGWLGVIAVVIIVGLLVAGAFVPEIAELFYTVLDFAITIIERVSTAIAETATNLLINNPLLLIVAVGGAIAAVYYYVWPAIKNNKKLNLE